MEQIIASLITVIGGTAISVFFSIKQYRLNRDNTEKELFKEYNSRYSQLNNKLSLLKTKELKNILENKEHYDTAMEFFNLCAEEHYWKKKKRISTELWECWSSGMNNWMKQVPALCELWEIEMIQSGPESYYIKTKYEFFSKSHFHFKS